VQSFLADHNYATDVHPKGGVAEAADGQSAIVDYLLPILPCVFARMGLVPRVTYLAVTYYASQASLGWKDDRVVTGDRGLLATDMDHGGKLVDGDRLADEALGDGVAIGIDREKGRPTWGCARNALLGSSARCDAGTALGF
jgi:hypothetical protein